MKRLHPVGSLKQHKAAQRGSVSWFTFRIYLYFPAAHRPLISFGAFGSRIVAVKSTRRGWIWIMEFNHLRLMLWPQRPPFSYLEFSVGTHHDVRSEHQNASGNRPIQNMFHCFTNHNPNMQGVFVRNAARSVFAVISKMNKIFTNERDVNAVS